MENVLFTPTRLRNRKKSVRDRDEALRPVWYDDITWNEGFASVMNKIFVLHACGSECQWSVRWKNPSEDLNWKNFKGQRWSENGVISAVNQMIFIKSNDEMAELGTNKAELAGVCRLKFRFIAHSPLCHRNVSFLTPEMNDIDDARMMTKISKVFSLASTSTETRSKGVELLSAIGLKSKQSDKLWAMSLITISTAKETRKIFENCHDVTTVVVVMPWFIDYFRQWGTHKRKKFSRNFSNPVTNFWDSSVLCHNLEY